MSKLKTSKKALHSIQPAPRPTDEQLSYSVEGDSSASQVAAAEKSVEIDSFISHLWRAKS